MVEKQETSVSQQQQIQTGAAFKGKELNQVPLFMTAAVTETFNLDAPTSTLVIRENFKGPQEIKPDEVLVKMSFSSVNPMDYYLNTGKLKLTNLPFVNGRDGCGQVVQLGEESSRFFKMHDMVVGATSNWQWGTFGQYSVFKYTELAKKPDQITVEHAAALPLILLTAWECFSKISDPTKLQRVLIHGGAGGVGSMCILLAKYYFNIPTVITTCRGQNCSYVKELGADMVINYNETDFATCIQEKCGKSTTGGAPLDLVIDPVGGNEILEKSYSLLDGNGAYITTVPLKNIDKNASEITELIGYGWDIVKNKVMSVLTNAPSFYAVLCKYDGRRLEQLMNWMVQKNLQDKFKVIKYPLNEIKDALDLIHSGHADGKLIIDMTC